MQIFSYAGPWELLCGLATKLTPACDDDASTPGQHQLSKRHAKDVVLPSLPAVEARVRTTRAVKEKDAQHAQIRRLVDERGHDVIIHHTPIAQGQFGRAYVGIVGDGEPPMLRIYKKLRLKPAPDSRGVESCTAQDLAIEVATAARACSALAPEHVLVTQSRKAHTKAYLEMPVMRGTLRELLSAASRDDRSLLARALLADGLAQLAQAHAHGVVHRDIKPDNVFFDETHMELGDWGLACFVADRGALRRGAGTPTYVAPEVLCRSLGERGAAMDLWSLGITALQVLLGEDAPWQQVPVSGGERDTDGHGTLSTELACLAQAHQHYAAWRAGDDASPQRPEVAHFANTFEQVDEPLRSLLLHFLAPHADDRGTAEEHLLGFQQALALGLDAQARLHALYAAQRSTRDAVEARQHALAQALACDNSPARLPLR